MEKTIRESSTGERMGIRTKLRECLSVNRDKGPFLSVYVDDAKIAGKKQNIDPCERS